MEFKQTYTTLDLNKIHDNAKTLKDEGARYVQILAVNYDDAIDLVYTFMSKDGELKDFNIDGISKDAKVESISDLYFEAFVCENEIHDLFGLTFENLKLDFAGKFYSLSEEKPMTVISPAELARREKEAKIAAAKAKAASKAKGKTETEVGAEGEEDVNNG